MLRRLLASWLILLATTSWAGVYEDMIAAAHNNNAEVVMNLVQRGMDVNTSDRSGTTLLMFAAGHGNDQLVEFLLRNRSNALKLNKYGDSAVGLAALKGHLPVVRRLVEAGANLRGKGWGPLHYAAFAGHTEILQFLLGKGVAIDARAPNGQTALMLAAKNGHRDVVKLLIDADADMDLNDPDGNTALSLAKGSGNTDIADYLRGEGAHE